MKNFNYPNLLNVQTIGNVYAYILSNNNSNSDLWHLISTNIRGRQKMFFKGAGFSFQFISVSPGMNQKTLFVTLRWT